MYGCMSYFSALILLVDHWEGILASCLQKSAAAAVTNGLLLGSWRNFGKVGRLNKSKKIILVATAAAAVVVIEYLFLHFCYPVYTAYDCVAAWVVVYAADDWWAGQDRCWWLEAEHTVETLFAGDECRAVVLACSWWVWWGAQSSAAAVCDWKLTSPTARLQSIAG